MMQFCSSAFYRKKGKADARIFLQNFSKEKKWGYFLTKFMSHDICKSQKYGFSSSAANDFLCLYKIVTYKELFYLFNIFYVKISNIYNKRNRR